MGGGGPTQSPRVLPSSPPQGDLEGLGRVSRLLFQESLGSRRHVRFSKIKSWYQHLRVFPLGVWLEKGSHLGMLVAGREQ